MFGWIRRMYDGAVGAIDNTVRSWVHDLVNGLYGFLHIIFGDVGEAWKIFRAVVNDDWRALGQFLDAVGLRFYHLYRVLIPAIIREYRTLIAAVEKYAKYVLAWAANELLILRRYVDDVITAVRRWVVTDIWNPIWRTLTAAWNWVTHEGNTIWHYITHIADLVDLFWDALIAKIESESWTVAEKLGSFALSLVVRNLKRFATLVEDILDAIL